MGLTGTKYRLKSVYMNRLNSGVRYSWARTESPKSTGGLQMESDVFGDNLVWS